VDMVLHALWMFVRGPRLGLGITKLWEMGGGIG
jgi:hypothetical protein